MIQFKALLIKEFKEAFRDKRALMAALLIAFMAPVMIFSISKVAIKEAIEKPTIYAQILGSEFSPKLMDKFKKDKILPISKVPDNEKYLWQDRNIKITIPKFFAKNMFLGKTIEVVLNTDYSDKAMDSSIQRIKKSVDEYSRRIGHNRLLVRGVDIQLLHPVKLIEQDTALLSSNAAFISMLLGIYLLVAAFVSGLPVAIDSSAGERERNVLEMLLCQPIATIKIVFTKMTCASVVAATGVILTLGLTALAVSFVDLAQIGATFSLDFYTVMVLLALLLPICFFASSLQLFFAFQAKSFKEAQSTVTMIIMMPAFIPMALTFINDKPKWLDWMPISGQSLLMEDLFKGIPVNWSVVLFTGAVTLMMTFSLIHATAYRLKSEKAVMALG
ncbi:protein NatB [Pseudoalteromonas sp. NBT06-2]|uniref:ABC transporter permease n=1 Tax=Pseudoalteromonas sp. NBT06-2 TaxID=2025950 RepID=UPI000BA76591|nr:ABC transporter permease [Pseudoalteromonas sp. NBT06-2]PAJ74448.1 protein NatB [Pseudoalteromonas sp. NBT06-2]